VVQKDVVKIDRKGYTMIIWNKFCEPPVTALKKIGGGKLSGKTDINPQWRLKALTEVFGTCGEGWKYTIDKLWHETGPEGRVMAFALISLYYKQGEKWSEAIPGIGGNMMADIEKGNLVSSDECYKMAVTDALSVACKALGVASAIYEGNWDGSKYQRRSLIPEAPKPVLAQTRKEPINEPKKPEPIVVTPSPEKVPPRAPEPVKGDINELVRLLKLAGHQNQATMLQAVNLFAGVSVTKSDQLTDAQIIALTQHYEQIRDVRDDFRKLAITDPDIISGLLTEACTEAGLLTIPQPVCLEAITTDQIKQLRRVIQQKSEATSEQRNN
jgi:hypothetical protein